MVLLSALMACGGADPAMPSLELPAASCEDPELRDTLGPFERIEMPPGPATGTRFPVAAPAPGMGLAVDDFDGDGRLDVYLPTWYGHDQLLLQQEDGGFVDGTAALGLAGSAKEPSEGALAADVTGDGHTDLVVLNRGTANVLYVADGLGGFEAPYVLRSAAENSVGAAAADYDGDGLLDLLIANRDEYDFEGKVADDNVLLVGVHGGFSDSSALLPMPEQEEFTFVAALTDLDGDGIVDVYIANDHGNTAQPNRFLRGGPAGLVDVSVETNTGVAISAMGLGLGDLNGDGRPDLVMSNWGPLVLLESLDDGTYYESQQARGLEHPIPDGEHYVTWGIDFADIDNDGDLDVPVAAGTLAWDINDNRNPADQPDALFVQEEGLFVDMGPAYGFDDPREGRGLAVTDLDQDGWLDIIVRYLDAPAVRWMGRCGDAGWLQVVLDDSQTANRRGVGSRVEIEADGVSQVRWLQAGGHSVSLSVPPMAHFGLGDAMVVDVLTVHWPDGGQTVLEDVPARQRVVVER